LIAILVGSFMTMREEPLRYENTELKASPYSALARFAITSFSSTRFAVRRATIAVYERFFSPSLNSAQNSLGVPWRYRSTTACEEKTKETELKRKQSYKRFTYLPVDIIRLDNIPVTLLPPFVDFRPTDDGDRVAKNLQHRVPIPIDARVVPHSVQPGDVISKGGCGWIRNIVFCEDEGGSIPENDRARAA
jgi:hypothetical protein